MLRPPPSRSGAARHRTLRSVRSCGWDRAASRSGTRGRRRLRAGPMPRSPRSPPPAHAPPGAPCTSRSSRVPTTAGPRRAPTPSSRPGSPGWWSAAPTPTRWSTGRASPPSDRRVSRSRWRPPRRVDEQLAAYAKHRTTGRPWVVLKLASSLDGGIAAPDGTSRWITGEPARMDAHRLRARSDAVLVGAGTVRTDDPALTVRLPPGDPCFRGPESQPLRVVLGTLPGRGRRRSRPRGPRGPGRRCSTSWGAGCAPAPRGRWVPGGSRLPCFRTGRPVRPLPGSRPVRGDDARPVFAGPGAPTIDDLWRGAMVSVTSLGGDLRVELSAAVD